MSKPVPSSLNNDKIIKKSLLVNNKPPNEREIVHLPTFVNLVGASFHGLHGTY